MVRFLRGENRRRAPRSLIDAWLLQRFPGRTLEELDSIDYGRFLRAVTAERMEALELRRKLYLESKLEELTPDEWAVITAHDAMVEDDEDHAWPTND